jgi:hypothetical protein
MRRQFAERLKRHAGVTFSAFATTPKSLRFRQPRHILLAAGVVRCALANITQSGS